MRGKLLYVLLIPLLIFIVSFRQKSEVKPARLILQMNDSIKSIKTLRINIYALERIGKSYLSANSFIKLQTNPRRLYFKNPEKKIEVLYNYGKLNNKALVKPNVFPYVTMALDPTGNIMRKNQHYTINELGFDFVGKSVALALAKDKDGINNLKYYGKVVKNGYNCYMVEYENKNYSYVNYTVGEKETIAAIANKLVINDYLVRYHNDMQNEFGYLKKGKVIKVPTLYCKKATIYLDEKTMMPVVICLYDDEGVFENYEFSQIQINKPINEDEFTRDYKDYKF